MKKLKKAISIVIRDDSGKVFVVKRSMKKNTFPGHLSLPSIYVLDNESFYETATKLAKERLSLNSIEISQEPFAVSEIVDRPDNLLQMYNFFALDYQGNIAVNKQDYESGSWMRLEELHEHIMTRDNGYMGECTRNFLKYEGFKV